MTFNIFLIFKINRVALDTSKLRSTVKSSIQDWKNRENLVKTGKNLYTNCCFESSKLKYKHVFYWRVYGK